MKRWTLGIAIVSFLALPASAQSLFETLQKHDGQSYSGKMSFSNKPNDEMNKPMQMTVKVISENEIRVPFQVGENKSRTWILTRSADGVTLKHDHRHEDGTPDELTNYGGTDGNVQLGNQLIFPADQETITMLPEAATNAWSLRLSPDGKQLFYYLERHKLPRFEAVFDLSNIES